MRRLTVMLEGQVAALSAGLLSPAEVVDLLDALARSDLYREDQHSYVLYPDRELPRFLEKNVVPGDAVTESKLLSGMLERGDRRIVEADATGAVHFASGLRNGRLLKEALARPAFRNSVSYRLLPHSSNDVQFVTTWIRSPLPRASPTGAFTRNRWPSRLTA